VGRVTSGSVKTLRIPALRPDRRCRPAARGDSPPPTGSGFDHGHERSHILDQLLALFGLFVGRDPALGPTLAFNRRLLFLRPLLAVSFFCLRAFLPPFKTETEANYNLGGGKGKTCGVDLSED